MKKAGKRKKKENRRKYQKEEEDRKRGLNKGHQRKWGHKVLTGNTGNEIPFR